MKKGFIILGTLIAVMPYTGFSGEIKELFFLFSGLIIAIMGYVVNVVEPIKPPEPTKEETPTAPSTPTVEASATPAEEVGTTESEKV